MPGKKRGLGRSFDSLLPTETLNEAFDPTAAQDEKISELRQIAVADIYPDAEQPRHHFDEEALHELAESIKVHGIVQPLVVRAQQEGYQIVAGERRWRAAKEAGLAKVPALVRTLSDQHKLELSLIENLQRSDLNPLETATAYLKLRDQFNMTLEEISDHIGGKAISTISNAMRLLRLPDSAKQALIRGDISEAHSRQILALETVEEQEELLNLIVKEGWTVRRTEQYIVGYKKGTHTNEKRVQAKKSIQTETPVTKALSKRLAAPVEVKTMARGGKLMIRFKDEEDLERISKMLESSS